MEIIDDFGIEGKDKNGKVQIQCSIRIISSAINFFLKMGILGSNFTYKLKTNKKTSKSMKRITIKRNYISSENADELVKYFDLSNREQRQLIFSYNANRSSGIRDSNIPASKNKSFKMEVKMREELKKNPNITTVIETSKLFHCEKDDDLNERMMKCSPFSYPNEIYQCSTPTMIAILDFEEVIDWKDVENVCILPGMDMFNWVGYPTETKKDLQHYVSIMNGRFTQHKNLLGVDFPYGTGKAIGRRILATSSVQKLRIKLLPIDNTHTDPIRKLGGWLLSYQLKDPSISSFWKYISQVIDWTDLEDVYVLPNKDLFAWVGYPTKTKDDLKHYASIMSGRFTQHKNLLGVDFPYGTGKSIGRRILATQSV